jgi:hypothetical protein
MAEDEKSILQVLVKALQQREGEEDDKDLKTLFRDVRDELRIMNGNTKEDRAAREQDKEMDELARTAYPALRSRRAGATHLETPAG